MKNETKKKLQSLELGDLVIAIEEQENNIIYVDKTFDERMELLTDNLIEIRYNKLVKKLTTNACLKYDNASIESVDCELRGIDKNIIINLSNMRFIESATNLVITGPTGSGKTYLACALGVEACKHTYRTYYIRMQNLVKRIDELSSNQKQLKIWLKRLANYSLLIIDEWLTNKPTDRDVKFLYELFDLRSEVNSTIFISQFDKSTWHDRLGGGVHAESIMDRISHNAYKIPSATNNIRKHIDNEKLNKFIEEIEAK